MFLTGSACGVSHLNWTLRGCGEILLPKYQNHRDRTNNDFTAGIVRVKVGAAWRDLAKVGRHVAENSALLPVNWDEI